MNIIFKMLTHQDCELLHPWLQLPQVREFWDDGDRSIDQVKLHYLKNDDTKRYLIWINNQSVGYIQSYQASIEHRDQNVKTSDLETIGIDFFIGNPEYLNRGLAIYILSHFISFRCQNADRILVDPETRNRRAIHIYEKYGFEIIDNITIKNKSHYIMAINIRRTARAIILNSKTQILLIEINENPLNKSVIKSSFWVTPGGRVEKNETIESALLRELHEEVDITEPINYELLAFGEQVLLWNDFPTRFIENFFIVHSDAIDLENTHLTLDEKTVIKGYRWWSLSELSDTKKLIFPKCLKDLMQNYLTYMTNWHPKEIPLD